jgi:hypothetical protein
MALPAQQERPSREKLFQGFEPLTANFVYCPNQLFDVCLPYNSRGVVRLVAYVIRQSLGFRDADGNPIRQNISIPFQDFINKARISRGAIGPAIKIAIENNFIVCTTKAASKSKGLPAKSGAYALKWGTNQSYIANPDEFDGFYTGPGCRTPIPNSYFDQIIASETLAVSKVVGVILRHTIGYESQFGRREQVDLSYTTMQNFVKIRDRKTLADAVKRSLDQQYICRVKAGKFASDEKERTTSRYGVKWLEQGDLSGNGSKTQPASDRFKNPTKYGSKTQPANRFKNPTSLKTQLRKENNKQPVAVNKKVQLLLGEWFDSDTIETLLNRSTLQEIENQVAWLPFRNPGENPAGMLRRSIEDSWSAPADQQRQQQRQNVAKRQATQLAAIQDQTRAENDAIVDRKQSRQSLLANWNSLSAESQQSLREAAITSAKSEAIKRILKRNQSQEVPHWFILKQLEKSN